MANLKTLHESVRTTIEATLEAHKVNQEKFNMKNMLMGGSGVGERSKSINVQGLKFDITKENDTLEFTVRNFLDHATILGQLKFNKTFYDENTGNLLYSHLVDTFDALLLTINECERGFIQTFNDAKFSKEHPKTVFNLKPRKIELSKDLLVAAERLDAVIKAQAMLLLERKKRVEAENKQLSDNQN